MQYQFITDKSAAILTYFDRMTQQSRKLIQYNAADMRSAIENELEECSRLTRVTLVSKIGAKTKQLS